MVFLAKITGWHDHANHLANGKTITSASPLSDAQHALIEEAVSLTDQDKAAWARAILLEVAKRQIDKSRKASKPEDTVAPSS
jgi:hypothetical protein